MGLSRVVVGGGDWLSAQRFPLPGVSEIGGRVRRATTEVRRSTALDRLEDESPGGQTGPDRTEADQHAAGTDDHFGSDFDQP